MNNVTILGYSEYEAQTRRLGAELNIPVAMIDVHRFPDDESLVRLPTNLTDHVILVRSLNQPNDKLIELFLSAQSARRLGAKRVSLVAPYLCYMRQDIENRPGEAISQRIIGEWLSEQFDDVITVDPHLHRISHLFEAIPLKNAISLSAAPIIGEFIGKNFSDAVIIGPDSESEQWVSVASSLAKLPYFIGKKTRYADRHVSIEFDAPIAESKSAIIVDDVLSTGHTLAQAAQQLRNIKPIDIYVIVTHPLFCGDAETILAQAGIKATISTDSVSHKSNQISLAPILAEAVNELIRKKE